MTEKIICFIAAVMLTFGGTEAAPAEPEAVQREQDKQASEGDTAIDFDAEVFSWDGPVLTKRGGVNYGPTGKETYYDQPMWTLISWARSAGYDEETYPYWVRSDGCKMLGKYIMCAANLDHFPRYSIVPSSLGLCIVVDTGTFIYMDEGWSWLDIATDWTNPNGE